MQPNLPPVGSACETPKFMPENIFKSSGMLKASLKQEQAQENFRSIQVESQGQGQAHQIPLA